jgi:hypothetical protein
MSSKHSSIASFIAQTEQLLSSGSLSDAEKADAEAFLQEIGARPSTEIAAYDFFLAHMPGGEADIALIILKGHLLVEQRVREFVESRLSTPGALSSARLTSHQLICLAEAMCLANPEPIWLWATVRELNSLRNSLAHNLAPAGIQDRIDQFLDFYHERHSVQGGLINCIGNLYAQVVALAAIAMESEFQIPRASGEKAR